MSNRDKVRRTLAEVRLPDRPLTDPGPFLCYLTIDGLDHAYLSRMVHGHAPVNVEHVRRVAKELGLNAAYFSEVREADVLEAVRKDAKFRDEIYFRLAKRGQGT